MDEALDVNIICRDDVTLRGHLWVRSGGPSRGIVVINPATGVLARYYHHYARFLAGHGFDVLTYDYRGIGLSRPERLRGQGFRWSDWGELDFDAALAFARNHHSTGPLMVVGHSIGGYLPGLSRNSGLIDRMLTVGAQYGYWRDYAPAQRTRLFVKWHVAMPALTMLFGYFPGKRLGWIEDLPAGVANEWAFRRARMEMSHPAGKREDIVQRFAAVSASILAIAVSDDPFGTVPALRRTLGYYRHAKVFDAFLTPHELGFDSIGHFGLFHARHASGFWRDTIPWLREGINPWPHKRFEE